MILSFIRGLLGGRIQPVPSSRPTDADGRSGARPLDNSDQAKSQPQEIGPATLLDPPAADAAEPIVLSFRMAIPQSPKRSDAPASASRLPPEESSRGAKAEPTRVKRRHRTLSLRAAGLGSAPQRRALRSIGIQTTDDVLAADPVQVAQRLRLSSSAGGTLRRWQLAIRLSRRLPAMTPGEALLLQAVHRGTLRRIGEESAPRLRRDLARYAMSTAGTRLLAGRPLPTSERVKVWVEAARKRVQVG